MTFIVDKQTLEDLNIPGKFNANSIFSLFNRTRTREGERLLESMFQQPLSDTDAINARAGIFRFFIDKNYDSPIDKDLYDSASDYFRTSLAGKGVAARMGTLRKKFMNRIGTDNEYESIYAGLMASTAFLQRLSLFFDRLAADRDVPEALDAGIHNARTIFGNKKLTWIKEHSAVKQYTGFEVARYDAVLRSELSNELHELFGFLAELDVWISVAGLARERGFTLAQAVGPFPADNQIDIEGVYHPHVEKAVANDIRINKSHNVIFLTGANMAGKSTLMKSFSIAVYLAHMGFPVAARAMTFSVQDGMYTSINVSDNLNLGYSHFYAEVMRVKTVAEQVAAGKRLLVVFDELFKGTNVKDAYDATVAVSRAFSRYRNCSFIISTHITEAGHALRGDNDNFRFVYVPTTMEDGRPRYSYKLQEGITDDRHGMIIIQNEGIIDIIKRRIVFRAC